MIHGVSLLVRCMVNLVSSSFKVYLLTLPSIKFSFGAHVLEICSLAKDLIYIRTIRFE